MYAKRPAEDYRGPAFLLTALARLLLHDLRHDNLE